MTVRPENSLNCEFRRSTVNIFALDYQTEPKTYAVVYITKELRFWNQVQNVQINTLALPWVFLQKPVLIVSLFWPLQHQRYLCKPPTLLKKTNGFEKHLIFLVATNQFTILSKA